MADICENTDSEHYDNRLQEIKIMVGKWEQLFSLSFLCSLYMKLLLLTVK